MYPISNAFLTAVKANTRKYYWAGRITTEAGEVYEFDIALHPSTVELMTQYDAAAEKAMPGREIHFPYKDAATPLTADMVTWEFHKVWDSINTENAVPYDFRHNYAIQNINSWLSEGFDFNDKFLYQQRRGSRDGDLKPKAAGASGLCQMLLVTFSVREEKMVDRGDWFVWKFASN